MSAASSSKAQSTHSVEETIKIYTDWANHYLEKARSKQTIRDLQHDVNDGVLLAIIIEAVTNDKIPAIKPKPRTSSQMIENIEACLSYLANLGVNIDGLSAKAIHNGNLKGILGLFFSLSRYKQQQKNNIQAQQQRQQQQQRKQQSTRSTTSGATSRVAPSQNNPEMLSRLPSPFKKGQASKETAMANAQMSKKSGSFGASDRDRVRPSGYSSANQTQGQGSSIPTSRTTSAASSRSTSPSSHSGIPTPGGRSASRSNSLSDKHGSKIVHSTSTSSASSLASNTSGKGATKSQSATAAGKKSMLDKLFNSKERDKTKANVKTKSTPKSDAYKDPSKSLAEARAISHGKVTTATKESKPGLFGKSKPGSKVKEDKNTPGLKKNSPSAGRKPATKVDPKSAQGNSPSSVRKSKISAPIKGVPAQRGNQRTVAQNINQSAHSVGQPPGGSGRGVPGQQKSTGLSRPNTVKVSNQQAAADNRKASAISAKEAKGGTPFQKIPQTNQSRPLPPSRMPTTQLQSPQQEVHPGYNTNSLSRSQGQQIASPSSGASTPSSGIPRGFYKAAPNRAGNESGGELRHPQILSPTGSLQRVKSPYNSLTRRPQPAAILNNSPQSATSQPITSQRRDSAQNNTGHSQPVVNSPTNSISRQSSGGSPKQNNSPQSGSPQHSGSSQQGSPQHVVSPSNSLRKTSPSNSLQRRIKMGIKYTENNVERALQSSGKISNSASSMSDSNNSTSSKSGNSDQSNDSVIYRPSETEDNMSGLESDSNMRSVNKPERKIQNTNGAPTADDPTSKIKDHITALKEQRERKAAMNNKNSNGPKVETTFDSEVTTENIAGTSSPKETTFEVEEDENFELDTMDIKPMEPLERSTPYSYLRAFSKDGTDNQRTFNRYNFPGSSSYQHTPASQASSRIGVNRLLDPNKFLSNSMKRTTSNCQSVQETDYGSDAESCDMAGGYVSDGDVLRTNRQDDYSGYMSEGGASLYARRMQQRFREGMQAVRECMQKSNQLIDNDSFDDESSISSGEISDSIDNLSTDDNIVNAVSAPANQDEYTHYSGSPNNHKNTNQLNQKHYNSLDSASNSPYMRYKKDDSRKLNILSDSEIDTGPWERRNDLKSNFGGRFRHDYVSVAPVLKNSAGSQSDIVKYSGGQSTAELTTSPRPAANARSNVMKQDSGTNTDTSSFIRKVPNQRGVSSGMQPPGAVQYAYRRQAGNVAIPTAGGKYTQRLSNMQGTRLANPDGSPRVYAYKKSPGNESAPEMYSTSTLERMRNRGIIPQSKTQIGISNRDGHQGQQLHGDMEQYRSNTLGRKRPDSSLKEKLFGSRNSLNKGQTGQGGLSSDTIISNPHATLSTKKAEGQGQPGQRPADNQGRRSLSYINNYLSPDLSGNRPASTSSPIGWMKNGRASPVNGAQGQMSDTESMDSLPHQGSTVHQQIQTARALGNASRNLIAQEKESNLHRSDSFKSSKSERLYPTYMQQKMSPSTDISRTGSFTNVHGVPGNMPSPSGSTSSRSSSHFAYPLTPFSLSSMNGGGNIRSPSQYSDSITMGLKDDIHGSALSLASQNSSVYSTQEDKQASEIRKLRRELEAAQDKVSTLTTQLGTNAHVVAAFEQSLSNMTNRLSQLTSTAEQKDSELMELRATIERLQRSGNLLSNPTSQGSMFRDRDGSISGLTDTPKMTRHLSNDSMSSINSMSSACSGASQQSSATDTENGKKKHKKGWLRSSFSKAFTSKKKKNKNGSMSDVEPDTASVRSDHSLRSDHSVPNSPMLHGAVPPGMGPLGPIKMSTSSHAFGDHESDTESVIQLQMQLREKDMKLTDVRLEALSSASQLEQLRDTMTRMKNEMSQLKNDNDRLQTMITGKAKSPDALSTSMSILKSTESLDKRLSLGSTHSNLDLLLHSDDEREGRRVTISVFLGANEDQSALAKSNVLEAMIGSMSVSGKIKWDMLDTIVKRVFKEYVLRLDPTTNLGLSGDSIMCYHIGDVIRQKDSPQPEFLPCGYLVGDNMQIKLSLRGAPHNSIDCLAFESLIPKSILQRYVSLLMEHRRIILCGPSGTGKTYLAQKLAEHLLQRSNTENTAGAIATFNVDHKSSKELRQYLQNIAEQCETPDSKDLPSVIILDNLHHVSSLGEVFNGFLNCKYLKCPYIIGTMNQATCSTTNLQLHHNFRWVLCANHMEPVKGFLGRYLRRKLCESEVKTGSRNPDLSKVVDWMPKVWQHLNKFLETHSSSDVTIGPRLFLSCPMDMAGSQVWFTDLWNYSITPYLLEAVREGIQLYGRRAPWEDPAEWVIGSYPWTNVNTDPEFPNLLRLRPEDVGYENPAVAVSGTNPKKAEPQTEAEDPLLSMLMKLQEAASYSSPQSADSDNVSLDSHSSVTSSNTRDENTSSSVESTI
ncbi:unnamed protein product [Owenia fusiformis]|uniref:Uncharacterized protein n=1 Tax=Owenia fusiformis TaxID=6347 RepID=A0A8J1XK11_OWEFU|nr:unnamed protein product [Owenia fusiformis]